jgi:hypothetical protein
MTFDNQIVSIIVRTNQEKRLPLLQNALISIIKNDYRPIEIIIVAQSEQQNFIEKLENICQEFTTKNIQVKLVINRTSQDERAKNLNLGINAANGRYIGFLDDDDIVYKHHISSLIKKINSSEYIAWAYSQVAASICYLNNNCEINILSLDYPFKKENFSLPEILKDNFIPIHSYLIDRNKIEPENIYFNETFPVLEDYEFLLRLTHKYQPSYIDQVTCEYRFYTNNLNPNIDIYSVLNYKDIKNAKVWLREGQKIEKFKKILYPEYTSGLISSNRRKFLLSKLSFLNIVKKRFPHLWKLIKKITSAIRLI